MVSAAVLFLATLLLLGGCVSGVSVKIENHTDKPLVDVVVSGDGFNAKIRKIDAGGAETLHVRQSGKPRVAISFEADGRRYSQTSGDIEDEFLDNVVITVDADFSIRIDINAQ
jgi:hypothetical protein